MRLQYAITIVRTPSSPAIPRPFEPPEGAGWQLCGHGVDPDGVHAILFWSRQAAPELGKPDQ